MSRNTSTAPATRPSRLQIGAALSSMVLSVPSLAISTVWLARPVTPPSRMARCAGFSTGSRLDSPTMRKTSSIGLPAASAWDHPVSDSATGFSDETRPCRSLVITASPMLASVTRSCSALDASLRSPATMRLPTTALVATASRVPRLSISRASSMRLCNSAIVAILRDS